MVHVVCLPSLQAPQVTRIAERLTRRSRSNFEFAFRFLSPRRAEGVRAIYELCRVVDDIVDERTPGPDGVDHARRQLDAWHEELARIYAAPGSESPRTELGRRLQRGQRAFDYPREAFEGILVGVAMDLDPVRYESIAQLRRYSYRVASCVGLLCIALCGEHGGHAKRYAEHLGLALQYTNILRDVAEDAQRDRVYLPREFLEPHGLDPAELLGGRFDARLTAAARDFAEEAEAEYCRAWHALRRANAPALFPTEIMGRIYYRLLIELRARDFDMTRGRVVVRRRDKLKATTTALAHTALRSLEARYSIRA